MKYGIQISHTSGKPIIGKLNRKGDKFLDMEELEIQVALDFAIDLLKYQARDTESKEIELFNQKTGDVEAEFKLIK